MSARNPRQGFIAGLLAGMLETGGAERVREALKDRTTVDATRAELADAEQRLAATPRASGVYAEHEREVTSLRDVIALTGR